MGRGGWGAMGRPGEKPKDFAGTAKRLLPYFLPQKFLLLVVLVAAIIGTVFNIVGPKILGLATTKLFAGLIADFQVSGEKRGRKQGISEKPDASPHLSPVPGVDFGYIGRVLLILLGIVRDQRHLPVHTAVRDGGCIAESCLHTAPAGG